MWFYKSGVLSSTQLKKLAEHKYSCTNISLLDPVLQPWWNWLVARTPLWLAPNLITIVGLVINIITTIILISYSPDGKVGPPRWASFLCALGLFIYQSLDAIDGKQARRTNSSSPLGELFDHGCDSISTIFVALAACISCQLGHYPMWLFFQCFCAITLFYCAHWQTYVSGTLRFGKIDVTEAQITIMGIHIISSIFGSEIWLSKIFGNILDCELWATLSLTTILCGIMQIYFVYTVISNGGVGKNGSTVAIPIIGMPWNYIIIIGITFGYFLNALSFSKMFAIGGSGKNGSTVALPYSGHELRLLPLYFAFGIDTLLAVRYAKVIMSEGCGKNGSSVAGTSVLSPSIALILSVLPALSIAAKSPDHIFENHTSLYIIGFGMVAAKITNKLVISHMTKSEMGYFDWAMLGPGLLFLNQYFNCPLPEILLLWFTFIWGTFDLLCYCFKVCTEICDHLNIQLFKIPYPSKMASSTMNTSSQGTNVPSIGNLGGNPHDRNGGTTPHYRNRQSKQTSKKQINLH